jgi:hypothetical protein
MPAMADRDARYRRIAALIAAGIGGVREQP